MRTNRATGGQPLRPRRAISRGLTTCAIEGTRSTRSTRAGRSIEHSLVGPCCWRLALCSPRDTNPRDRTSWKRQDASACRASGPALPRGPVRANAGPCPHKPPCGPVPAAVGGASRRSFCPRGRHVERLDAGCGRGIRRAGRQPRPNIGPHPKGYRPCCGGRDSGCVRADPGSAGPCLACI